MIKCMQKNDRDYLKLAAGLAPFALGMCFCLVAPVQYAGMAHAADAMLEQPPEPPEPQIVPQDDWSGAYLGAYGGYGWFKSDISPGGDVDSIHGPLGGAYLGYNQQFGNNWVGGFEALGGASGAENSSNGVTINQDWDASLRARMGYAFENSLIYGLAGVAATGFEASAGGTSDSNVSLGWIIGTGLETKFTDNLSGRVEYNYSDYQNKDFSISGGSTSADLDGHSVKVGLGIHF
jgi:outer membrane immunogenic protein